MRIQSDISNHKSQNDTRGSFEKQLAAARAEVADAKSDIQSARVNFRELRASGASSEQRAEARAGIREARSEAREVRADLREIREAFGDFRQSGNQSAILDPANGGSGGGTGDGGPRLPVVVGDTPSSSPILDPANGGSGGGTGDGGPRLPVVVGDTPSPSVPTTDGQILGGTTVAGATIDPVAGDFSRDGGAAPIADVSVHDLGGNADGTRNIKINFTNSGPEGSTFLTPPWVAVQDGTFDIYDRGGPAADFLEALAEDGTVEPIGAAFAESGAVGEAGVITGPDGAAAGPLDPGETGSITLTVDPQKSQFLSFASMVIPSNDAFISSPGDPRGIRIFDVHGNFVAEDVKITGADVLDAGTEVNTEQDAAFLNQSAPDTGEDENGVVALHPGLIGSEALPATDDSPNY